MRVYTQDHTHLEGYLRQALWTADVETVDLNSKILLSLSILLTSIELLSLIDIVTTGQAPGGAGGEGGREADGAIENPEPVFRLTAW